MSLRNDIIPLRLLGGTLLAFATVLGVPPQVLAATPPVDPAVHAAHVAASAMPPDSPAAASAGMADRALSRQVSELQVKVAQLEATLAKTAPATAPAHTGAAMAGMPAAAPTANPPMSMGMEKMKSPSMSAAAIPAPAMASMGPPAAPSPGGMMAMMGMMMGMMDKMMPMPGGSMPAATPMAPMPPGGMAMMSMDMMEMAGMMGMAPMGGGASAASMPQSALPGFPGASHLYHLGATGFFLDHPQHIALSTDQTAALNKAKEQALLAKRTADRAIEQAEQELWTLTASDQPDAAKIEAKVRQTEKLTGDSRLAFVRAVGDASKILTDEQRKILTGFAPPAPAAMAPMKNM